MATDYSSTVTSLYGSLVSTAETLGVFEQVNPAAPWSTPGDGAWCAFTNPDVRPLGAASGLANTSVRLEFTAIVGASALMRPVGRADQVITAAAFDLMGALTSAFSLNALVRNVDIFGQHGAPLGGKAAFMTIGEHQFRTYEFTIPLIVNDLFGQAP